MSILEETTPNIACNISGDAKNRNREVCLKIEEKGDKEPSVTHKIR